MTLPFLYEKGESNRWNSHSTPARTYTYQPIRCGRRNCSAALSFKAAPCRSRRLEEVPGRFGSAISPLVGSAQNWWRKGGESLRFPTDGEKEARDSPSLPAPAIPLRSQRCRRGDTGVVGTCSPSWELACTEGARGNTFAIICLLIKDVTQWEVGFIHLAGFSCFRISLGKK